MDTSKEAIKLFSKRLRLERALKVVKKYWKAGPSLVCLSCIEVSHNCLGKCRARAVEHVICAGAHKVEDHRCEVIGFTVEIGKIRTHVTSKYANCGSKQQIIAFKCLARLKT